MAAEDQLGVGNAVRLLGERCEMEGPASARSLGGGVSSTVVLVEDRRRRVVLKQALPQLRVEQEWLADRSRSRREWTAISALGAVLPRGRLPRLRFHDERRFLYAMDAAPPGSADWKSLLLAGRCDGGTARQVGATLGLMIRGTWGRPEFEEPFADGSVFDQLRTDPYYRAVARRHPGLTGPVEEWIAESSRRRVAMVHGDWSPKNVLVGAGGALCIDFECAHYGDPSFDAGFMLNHLVLKAVHRPDLAAAFLRLARISWCWTLGLLPAGALEWFEPAGLRHQAFLMLARVDGKSPAEYLRTDEERDCARRLALELIEARPQSLDAALARVERRLAERSRATRLP